MNEQEWATWYARKVKKQPSYPKVELVQVVKLKHSSDERASQAAKLVARRHQEHVEKMQAERERLQLRRFCADVGRPWARALANVARRIERDKLRRLSSAPKRLVSLGDKLKNSIYDGPQAH